MPGFLVPRDWDDLYLDEESFRLVEHDPDLGGALVEPDAAELRVAVAGETDACGR